MASAFFVLNIAISCDKILVIFIEKVIFMLANYHTHTTFCDGKNTAEEVVLSAIENGFDAIGFSGHGYTDFDTSYCITDMKEYIFTINSLKEKYKNDIQIYIGVEEDCFCLCDRADFDYIIGSSHYLKMPDGMIRATDLSREYFEQCIEMYGGDILKLAEGYYMRFCEYIKKRKPDIVGHFDIITKYDENESPRFLTNDKYMKMAENYMKEALSADVIFEVNTGAIARGYRTNPYPQENLLHLMKKEDAKLVLSSDSHSADILDFGFDEAKKMLLDIGFKHTYVLYNGEWIKDEI